jgi:hypothetical protein
MMMRTPNFDRYTNQVAQMRKARAARTDAKAKAAQKPSKQPKAKGLEAMQQPTALIKPDYTQVITESLKLDGLLVITRQELAALVGFPEKDRHALNSCVKKIYAQGMSYTIDGDVITFTNRDHK